MNGRNQASRIFSIDYSAADFGEFAPVGGNVSSGVRWPFSACEATRSEYPSWVCLESKTDGSLGCYSDLNSDAVANMNRSQLRLVFRLIEDQLDR